MESIIAIDTNIIVRFITRDDELQYQQSLELKD
jgi:predicted nucleic-acid-binding protein